MKLHLPSGLRSALFACFAAVASLGATLATASITGGLFAVTLAGSAWAASVDADGCRTITGADNSNMFSAALPEDIEKVKFAMQASGTANWFAGNASLAKDIAVEIADSDGTNSGTGLHINNGGGGTVWIKGDVTGAGSLTKSGAGTNMHLLFTGDVSQYTGNIELNATRAFFLEFGGQESGNTNNLSSVDGVVNKSTAEKGVSGTGNIVFKSGSNELVYNYSTENTAYVTNAISTEGSVTSNLTVVGSAVTEFTKSVAVTNLAISGSASLKGAATVTSLNVASGATLSVGAGGSLTLNGAATLNGTFSNEGSVKVNGALSLAAAITNKGTLTFDSGATLDLSALTMENNTYSIFTPESAGGSVVGLTVDMLRGIETAGREWTIDAETGKISYEVTVGTLRWGDGPLTWQEGCTMEGGVFAQNDMVTFTGDAEVTLGGAVSSAHATINEGATVSISNGGQAANTLTASTLEVNGTLVLKGDVLATGTTLAGAGAVSLDPGDGHDVSPALLGGFAGSVAVLSGTYVHQGGTEGSFRDLTIEEGAQMKMESNNFSGQLILAGSSLSLTSSAVSGSLTLAGDSTITSLADSAINPAIGGEGDLTIGAGNTLLYIHGNVENGGKLAIQGGKVVFGQNQNATQALHSTALELSGGGIFFTSHATADFSATEVVMAGGELHSEDMDAGSGLSFGKMTVVKDGTHANTISYRWNGVFNFSELTGEGDLNIDAGVEAASETHVTSFGVIKDFSGTITKSNTGHHSLQVGTVDLAAGISCTIGMDVVSDSFAKLGEGALTISSLSASSQLYMNYEGSLLGTDGNTLTAITVADGTVLTYTGHANTLALAYTDLAGLASIRIDVMKLEGGVPTDGLDLGITGLTDATLTELQGKLHVAGLHEDEWSLSLSEGRALFSMAAGAEFSSDWDLNWDSSTLASAPESLKQAAPTATTYIGASGSEYLADGVSSIKLTDGGGDAVEIYGGANEAASTLDSWIDVAGGTWSLVVGGNYANNWGGGNPADFNGDSHIKMTAGTVKYIIGGNYKDGRTPSFNGDSYISVFGGTVSGSIIGGGVSVHSAGFTTNGNTNIFIYTPLSDGSAGPLVGGNPTPNAVIGGSLHGHNVLNGHTLATMGSTHITVDLSKHSGEATFVKSLVGGDFLPAADRSSAAFNAMIQQDTHITVTAPSDVTFMANIIAGSSANGVHSGSRITVGGSTHVTLNGGTYGNGTDAIGVIGGMLADDNRSGLTLSIGGTANVTLNGGTLAANANIIAGSYLGGSISDTKVDQGGSSVMLKGGSVAGSVLGGHYLAAGDASVGEVNLGSVNLTVDGTAVAGFIGGGSSNNRTSAEGSIKQGDITVRLLSGSVGSVYAAGQQNGTVAMTTSGTMVEIASGMTIAEGSVISGGYLMGAGAANATVTGESTLKLADTGYSNLANVGIDSFSVIEAASDVSLKSFTATADSLTKKGAGAVAFAGGGNLKSLRTIAIEGGSLDMGTSWVDGGLTAISVVAGSTFKAGGVGFSGSATLNLDLTGATGETAFVQAGTLQGLGEKLTVNLDGWSGLEVGVYKLMDWTSGALDIAKVEWAAAAEGFTLAVQDQTLVLSVGNPDAWSWGGADGEVWKDDSSTAWEGKDSTASPAGQVLYFDTLDGQDSAVVTIEGEVTPGDVRVMGDTAYTFSGEGRITGDATLEVARGATLTLATSGNSYTGDTLVQGELVIGAKDAITVSSITFDGGQLVYGVDETIDMEQLGTKDDAPIRLAVREGVTGSLQGSTAASFANGVELSGEGVLELVSTKADADLEIAAPLTGAGTLGFGAGASAVELSGDNSGFTGTMLMEGAADKAVVFRGDNAMGAGMAVLKGQGFAVAGDATNAAAIEVAADTTQLSQDDGATSTFTGAVTGDKAWGLSTDGSQTNALKGDLGGFAGKLVAATEDSDAYASWTLGGGEWNGEVKAGLEGSGDGLNIFTFSYAQDVAYSGAMTGNATLQQSGEGVVSLTGANTTTGDLYVESGRVVRLGTADKAASWAGSSLTGSGSFVLVNGTLTNGLAPATAKAPGGKLVVDTAENATVDMGGTQGSMIDGSITLAAGSQLTNVGGDLTVADGATPSLTLRMDLGNMGADGEDMILFADASSTLTVDTAQLTLDLSNEALKAALIEESGTTQLHVTNGNLVLDGAYGAITVNPLLDALGLHLKGVDKGALVLSGQASGVYKVLNGGAGDSDTVNAHGTLGMYQATFVDAGESLVVNLPGDVGTGAVVNNLIGLASGDASAPTSLVVNNSDPAAGQALLVLTNTVQSFDTTPEPAEAVGADTTFEGAIIGGADVTIAKDGAGTLTVTDHLVADTLQLQQGKLVLGNEGETSSSIGTLNLAGSDATAELALMAGDTSVSGLADDAQGGTVSLGSEATMTLLSGSTGALAASTIGGSGKLAIESGAELALADAAKLSGVALELAGTLDLGNTADSSVSGLDGEGTLKGAGGAIEVTKGGSFGGAMAGSGTLDLASAAKQSFANTFAGSRDWSITNHGQAAFNLVKDDGSNGTLTLDTLTLAKGSQTTITYNTDLGNSALELGTLAAESGAGLSLDSGEAQTAITGATFTLGTAESWTGDLGKVELTFSGYAFSLLDAEKSSLGVKNGNIVLNLAMTTKNGYAPTADNANADAGAEILWSALISGSAPAGTDLQKVTEALSNYISAGDKAEANRVMAAAAGASIATLSSAFAGDVDRQLRAIRNRTTTMGVDPCVVNEDMPYFNAWINAEGDYRKVDADGMMPGYTLSSWGGTLGFDVDINERTTAGLAFTAMYGDLESDGADTATGDLDTYYVTAFARYTSKRWVHTFVGTVGRMDSTLDRMVDYGSGSYKTTGDTVGTGLGLMYEVGYTVPMDEDAAFCLQPVFNLTWRHVDVDSYDEEGSDAALRAGSQSYDALTFGLGARAQAAVGENLYNRTSIFEARALLKLDAGDREGEADVSMLHGGPAVGSVRSAELGAVGIELGAGLTVPIGQESGSLFFDASAEIRSGATDVNGTVGYRINF